MIPTAYSLLEQHTWLRLQRAWARWGGATAAQRSLLEYNRAGWEFHAKGIWCAAFPVHVTAFYDVGSLSYEGCIGVADTVLPGTFLVSPCMMSGPVRSRSAWEREPCPHRCTVRMISRVRMSWSNVSGAYGDVRDTAADLRIS